LRYDKRQRGREWKNMLAALNGRLKQMSIQWSVLSTAVQDHEGIDLEVKDGEILLHYADSPSGRISLAPFAPEAIVDLLHEVVKVKAQLKEVRLFCCEIADPLD
jgi:hypothetical protein